MKTPYLVLSMVQGKSFQAFGLVKNGCLLSQPLDYEDIFDFVNHWVMKKHLIGLVKNSLGYKDTFLFCE